MHHSRKLMSTLSSFGALPRMATSLTTDKSEQSNSVLMRLVGGIHKSLRTCACLTKVCDFT